MPVALHIVNDGINHACNSRWQAQYLVRLEGEFYCFAHCK